MAILAAMQNSLIAVHIGGDGGGGAPQTLCDHCNKHKHPRLTPGVHAGSQDSLARNLTRSDFYGFNPMASVTTMGTSGSEAGSSTAVDQSCGDMVLMASPIRGTAQRCAVLCHAVI